MAVRDYIIDNYINNKTQKDNAAVKVAAPDNISADDLNKYLDVNAIKQFTAENAAQPAPKKEGVDQVTSPIPSLNKIEPWREVGAIESIYRAFNKRKEPESEQERQARLKREQANRNLFALSDALANIANLWSTSKGAAPQRLTSLSDINRQRYEYAEQQRRANEDAWTKAIINAKMADINNRLAQQKISAQQAQKEKEMLYKMQKDLYDVALKEKELGLKEKKTLSDMELAKKELEEKQRANKAREALGRKEIELREKSMEMKKEETPTTVRFGLSDGSNIEVPKDLSSDFYADVYNKLFDVANKNKDKEILALADKDPSLFVPKSQIMRDAVHSYARKYPEVEEYMKERANQYMQYYNKPVEIKERETPAAPAKAKIPGIGENTFSQTSLIDEAFPTRKYEQYRIK